MSEQTWSKSKPDARTLIQKSAAYIKPKNRNLPLSNRKRVESKFCPFSRVRTEVEMDMVTGDNQFEERPQNWLFLKVSTRGEEKEGGGNENP